MYFEVLPGGKLFQGVFFLAGQNWGGGILVLLLRNEGKFWYEAPCCCIIVDGCAVRDMWKPLVAEKIFIQLDLCDEKWDYGTKAGWSSGYRTGL